MGDVITSSSKIKCEHQGTVTPAPSAVSAVLFVDGTAVLAGTLALSVVGADCAQKPPPATNVQCGSIASETAGPSTVLFADGQAVLLDTAAGLTLAGVPTKNWSVESAEQDLLSAD
jgi:hypothetical protein